MARRVNWGWPPDYWPNWNSKGRVVTGDALYAQRELSRSILEQGGDYFWVVKDNQPGVREAVSLLFEHPRWGESFGEACLEGRHGDRWGTPAIVGIGSLERVLGLARVGTGLLCGTDQEAQGQGDGGAGLRRHSLPAERANAARLLEIWRGHWSIENRLHWVRDVVFGEDLSQVRTGSAPQLLAALRNLVIGLLRLSGVKNISAAPAPLRLETLGVPIPHRTTLQQLNDLATATTTAIR